MKRVFELYGQERELIIEDAKKGIFLYEQIYIFIKDLSQEKIEEMIKEAEELEMSLEELLDEKNIEYTSIGNGYYSLEEIKEKYKNHLVLDCRTEKIFKDNHFDDWEQKFYYEYWEDGYLYQISLVDEGTDVVYLKTVEKENTYQIDLYYDIEEEEVIEVYKSYYQGALYSINLEHERVIEWETIEKIEELIKKIDFEKRNNNLMNDAFDGFKIKLKLTDEEFYTMDYIESLFDYCEREEDIIFINKNYN